MNRYPHITDTGNMKRHSSAPGNDDLHMLMLSQKNVLDAVRKSA